jgi:hypothetical protein
MLRSIFCHTPPSKWVLPGDTVLTRMSLAVSVLAMREA